MKKLKTPPVFHMPPVFGIRPGNSFFFSPPIEGENLSLRCVSELPPGVSYDEKRNVFSGVTPAPGSWLLKLEAENAYGRTAAGFRLLAGEDIQLTPPMGWNSWYCFSEGVSDSRIRETAAALKERGLAAHGWNQVNIDDCWQGARGGKYHALQGNERFPDMKALGEYIHSLGLRFGIYSTPWISTYAGFRGGSCDEGYEERVFLPENERLQPHQVFGRYPRLEEARVDRTGSQWFFGNDVRQWAEWGVDFVKVDWLPNDIPTTRRIADELRNCGRDIVLSLSNNAPVEYAPELTALSQLCRITGDIRDEWKSISGIGFDHNTAWHKVLSPGHYPDPDMLQIGAIGIPNRPNPTYTPSRLTLQEQQLQLTLWSLLSAPLLLSCDIAGMDDATFKLLTNDEVLAIDQDPLAAPPVIDDPGSGVLLYRKPLADGGSAFGIFNRSDETQSVRLDLPFCAKELWSGEKRELCGDFTVAPHSGLLYRTAEC